MVCVAGSSHSSLWSMSHRTDTMEMEARFVISNCAAYDVHGCPKNMCKTVPVTSMDVCMPVVIVAF